MTTLNIRSVPSSKQHGFTMIELMIVVTIAAILAAAAAPSFSSFVGEQRIRSTSFDMMAMMTLARSEAIKRNANVSISLSGQILSTKDISNNTITEQMLSKGVTLTLTSGADLVFGGSGRMASTNTFSSVEISSTNPSVTAKRCVSLDLSGRPKSKVGAC